MSTRAQIRFATREKGQSFSERANAIHAQFYKHSDGYPEGLGLDIADSILNNVKVTNWEIEELETKHGDLDFIYYIWQAKDKETCISVFDVGLSEWCGKCKRYVEKDECIFVGTPTQLLTKYGSQLEESCYKIDKNNDR